MIELPKRPLLLIVSAPSGAGKTTLCDRLVAEFNTIAYSVSCTTRAPRAGEVEGADYFFLSEEEFDRRVKAGDFLEHALVHGHRYGTLKRMVLDAFRQGRDVLMDIDVQGARQIRTQLAQGPADDPLRAGLVDIFIAPPSLEVLRQRLHGRGQDAEAVIERRLQMAENEMAHWREYRYLVVNDQLETSYDALRAIVLAEHHRVITRAC